MLRRAEAGISVEVEQPLIYLDHWALRLLSSDATKGERFLAGLRCRGTLVISAENIAEISVNSGPSLQRIQEFLRAVGPRWAPMNLSVWEIAIREMAGYRGPPWLDVELLARAELDESLSLAAMIGELGVIAGVRRQFESLTEAVNRAREHVKEGGRWREARRDLGRAVWVSERLDRLVVTDQFRFNRNHALDMSHAVAVAHADVVFLDGHWSSMVERLHLPHGFARVFGPPDVDDALDYLTAAWWSRPN